MKFLTDNEGLAINTAQIIAVKIKRNKNDGSFKSHLDYPYLADVFVIGREKPFTIYLTREQEAELNRFTATNGDSA